MNVRTPTGWRSLQELDWSYNVEPGTCNTFGGVSPRLKSEDIITLYDEGVARWIKHLSPIVAEIKRGARHYAEAPPNLVEFHSHTRNLPALQRFRRFTFPRLQREN